MGGHTNPEMDSHLRLVGVHQLTQDPLVRMKTVRPSVADPFAPVSTADQQMQPVPACDFRVGKVER